ncbi:MAG TPA: formyltransferase family protein [Longimicrobium sp.]
MSRRVVVLSWGGKFTRRLLGVLHQRGTPADALVLYAPILTRGPGMLRPLAARARRRLDPSYRRGARRVVFTAPLNHPRMVRDLRAEAPDVVVLATCSLLEPAVVEIPKLGVLNTHPGLLPWVRGNGPFANALLRGVPLGCTTLWIDRGIDTGPVVERRLLPVAEGDSARALGDRFYDLWVTMTADAIAAAAAGHDLPRAPQERRFALARTVTGAGELARVDALLAEGAAHALFERWRPFCTPDLRLPPEADARIAAAGLDENVPLPKRPSSAPVADDPHPAAGPRADG